MLKKLLLAAAALAVSAPALADAHRKQLDHRNVVRHHGQVVHHYYYYRPHRPVVVMPPPRVYYAPPPRVVYAPVYRPAPVYYPPVPYGGISIRFDIPF